MLAMAAALVYLGWKGASWTVLLVAVPVGIVLHWMIWHEEIRAEWQAAHYLRPLLHLSRDLIGIAAAWGFGFLIFLLFIGAL